MAIPPSLYLIFQIPALYCTYENPTVLVLFILSTLSVPALAQDTTWFDGNLKETTHDHAKFFRTKTKTDQGWQVKDYWLSGDLQMTGNFTDDSCKVRQGEFAYYDEKNTSPAASTIPPTKKKAKKPTITTTVIFA